VQQFGIGGIVLERDFVSDRFRALLRKDGAVVDSVS